MLLYRLGEGFVFVFPLFFYLFLFVFSFFLSFPFPFAPPSPQFEPKFEAPGFQLMPYGVTHKQGTVQVDDWSI